MNFSFTDIKNRITKSLKFAISASEKFNKRVFELIVSSYLTTEKDGTKSLNITVVVFGLAMVIVQCYITTNLTILSFIGVLIFVLVCLPVVANILVYSSTNKNLAPRDYKPKTQLSIPTLLWTSFTSPLKEKTDYLILGLYCASFTIWAIMFNIFILCLVRAALVTLDYLINKEKFIKEHSWLYETRNVLKPKD